MALSTDLSRPVIKYRSPDATETALLNSGEAFTGRGFSHDGVNDQITIGNPGISCKSICFYVYSDTTTEQFIQLTSTQDVQVSSGTITATAWTTPTEYVDGIANDTIQATTWHFVCVTSATGITVNDMEIGEISAAFGAFDISNLKIFDVELTAAQVAELYQNPELALPTGIAIANLVGWWPLVDAGNSGYILDGSGSNNNGTLSGATAVTGIGPPVTQPSFKGISTPMWFDGSNDYVAFANETNYDFEHSDPFSVSVWILTDSASSDRQIFFKSTGTTASGYWARITPTNVRWNFNNAGGQIGNITTTGLTLNDGALHHLVFTFDGGSNLNGANIYHAGSLSKTGASTSMTGSILNALTFRLATDHTGAAEMLLFPMILVRLESMLIV